MDYLGLTRGDAVQNRKVLEFIKDSDALVYVLRGFDDDSVTHPLGGVDPVRDFETLEAELLIYDLDLAEKRLLNMEESARKGHPPRKEERSAVAKCREALEREMPLRYLEFDETEERALQASRIHFETARHGGDQRRRIRSARAPKAPHGGTRSGTGPPGSRRTPRLRSFSRGRSKWKSPSFPPRKRRTFCRISGSTHRRANA